MKKLNKKGFTLIELLAVITIMGILMIVAIPAISRTIENSRKDTFADTAKQYASSLKTLWASDSLNCQGSLPSEVSVFPDDSVEYYYVPISSKNQGNKVYLGQWIEFPVLLESGGKSSWGNKEVTGFGVIRVTGNGTTRKISFYVSLVDGTHGIPNAVEYTKIKRKDVVVSGATAMSFPNDEGWKYITIIDDDGSEKKIYAANCVEQ